ncbi:hypothetical protein GCM10023320_47500 [Pseudonocardia adelaidensis]|uniref:Uncharacterized protein n=1 Tax=Pseudonocardia adelaidensis TaxID=648754 RepID=A0ABP9NNM4_9PSEU
MPTSPEIDVTFTIAPRVRASGSAAARECTKAPRTFVANRRSKSASVDCPIGFRRNRAALLTSRSRRPNSRSATATARSADALSATSPTTGTTPASSPTVDETSGEMSAATTT